MEKKRKVKSLPSGILSLWEPSPPLPCYHTGLTVYRHGGLVRLRHETIRMQGGCYRCPTCVTPLPSCTPAAPGGADPLWQHGLDDYLRIVGTHGLPEKDRPTQCPECSQHRRRLHRHSQFQRSVFTPSQCATISIFRFRCPDCKYVHSVIPAFLEPYQRMALDLQEDLVDAVCNGSTLETVAERTDTFPGGSRCEKTIRRLVQGWERRLFQLESGLWAWLIARVPHLTLPRTGSLWSALRFCWDLGQHQLLFRKPLRFLHGLNRICFSLAVAGPA
jgi:hypothetical protein